MGEKWPKSWCRNPPNHTYTPPLLIGALSSPEHGNERGLWATGATLVAFALLIARFPADTDIFDGASAGAAGRGQKREGGELSRLLFFS